MKKTINIIFVGLLVTIFQVQSFAITVNRSFTVSATVPGATGVTINASSVTNSGGVFSSVTGTALNFGTLTFNTINGIWLPGNYFAIDIGSSGGAGVPTTTVSYTEGANPNSPGHGLGYKSAATFVKIVGTTETQLASHKKVLKNLTNEIVAPSEITGGFLRIYLGIVTGDPASTPADGEPFTNNDRPGTYDGTLLISATVPG